MSVFQNRLISSKPQNKTVFTYIFFNNKVCASPEASGILFLKLHISLTHSLTNDFLISLVHTHQMKPYGKPTLEDIMTNKRK